MQRLALAGSADESGPADDAAFRTAIGAYFGMGLVGGGLAGAALLLGVQIFAAGRVSSLGVQVPAAIAALAHWVPDSGSTRLGATRKAGQPDPQTEAFDVVIDRGARANASLGLHLFGSKDVGMQVVLRDVPVSAVLSRGERRDASTWVLTAGDLPGLRLALNDEVPDAFDVRIEVLAPAGFAAASSVARVRLVGSARVEIEAAVPAAPVAVTNTGLPRSVVPAVAAIAGADAHLPARAAASNVSNSNVNEVPKREKSARAAPPVVVAAAETERRAPQNAPPLGGEARHWPEGASGLGAMARESDRQVWWKLPAPTWSPFIDTAGR